MPLRITTIDGKRTVVCEPIPPAIGVLPRQKWYPTPHAAILQSALLRPRQPAYSSGRAHPSADAGLSGTDRWLPRLRIPIGGRTPAAIGSEG
jgi:hypothetical protein